MHRQRGQILIIAIVFTAILLTLSSALVGYTTLHWRGERQTLTQGQALELAEAGIDKAIYQLNQNPSYAGETATALGPGEFSVALSSKDANTKTITSTGYVPNSADPIETKIVKVDVSINTDTIAFNFGVQVGAGGLEMDNGSQVIGNIYSDGNITGGGTITGDAVVAGGTAPTPDQQWTTQNADFNLGDTNAHKDLAQSFVPSANIKLNKISVYLKKTGNPSDLNVMIMSDNAGKPSKTTVTTGAIAASTITGSYSFIDAGFASSPNLNAGQTYWIVLDAATISASNYFAWGLDSNSGYANGAGMYSSNWNAGSPVWNSAGGDFDFKVFAGGTDTYIDGVTVNGTAKAHSLTSCVIGGDAYFDTTNTCTTGGTLFANQADQPPQPMPISDAQIADWEAAATAGGTITGDQTITGSTTMGPKKIVGNLVINNGATLNMTGPIWVVGNITTQNNSTVTIDSSLGNSGTILIADNPGNLAGSGQIVVSNNSNVTGNGNSGSYLLVLSTHTGDNAIDISNNSAGAIYYTNEGTIDANNNASAKQLTGYSIKLNNNVTITYTNGLSNSNFSSGPGGSWAFVSGSYVIVK